MVCQLGANIHCMYLAFNSSRLHVVYRDIVYYLGGDLHISCHTMSQGKAVPGNGLRLLCFL